MRSYQKAPQIIQDNRQIIGIIPGNGTHIDIYATTSIHVGPVRKTYSIAHTCELKYVKVVLGCDPQARVEAQSAEVFESEYDDRYVREKILYQCIQALSIYEPECI